MSVRTAAWLAWTLFGITVAVFAVGVVFATLSLIADPSRLAQSAGGFLTILPFFSFPVVGVLIASRRPRNWIGWICLITGLFWTGFFENDMSTRYELARTGSVQSSVPLDALTQADWVFPVGLLGIYMILLFPDGRLPSRRWRPFALFAGAVIVLINVSFVLAPGPLDEHPGVQNPFGLEQFPWISGAVMVMVLMLPLCILVSAFSLVLRYRRSNGEMREQIKWLAFAGSFVGLTYLVTLVSGLLFSPDSYITNGTPPLWVSLSQQLSYVSFASVPIAIGFAVLKYRLYDIEIIINRALVYGPLTATLVLTYVVGVVSLQYAFRALTGSESQLAIVASTLAIAALFNPMRHRIQDFIDRRFYRGKYDARKTLEAFAVKLRDETNLQALSAELVKAVRETMEPERVSLWLREPSTSVKPKAES
jgi:hypothetical protein